MFDFQTTAFLLDAATQAPEQVGPGTAIIPVAVGFLFAIGVCGFFMRYAMKKGELDRKGYDPDKFKKRK
ncbi:hypothetical protein [Anaerotignum sp.]